MSSHLSPYSDYEGPAPLYVPRSLDWDRRTFGVEIEFYGCTPSAVEAKARALHPGVLDVRYENYNHQVRSWWKIVTDQSVATSISSEQRGTGLRAGLELVSPILHGESGFREIQRVSEVLVAAGAKINRSCGLHVHHQGRDLTVPETVRACRLYAAAQGAIDLVLPESRRTSTNNIYCGPLSEDELHAMGRAQSATQLRYASYSRYRVVNIESLSRHGTIEFRQHSGTIEHGRIVPWVQLTQAILRYACEGGEIQPSYSFEELMRELQLPLATVTYFESRRLHFASGRRARPSRSQATNPRLAAFGVNPVLINEQERNQAAEREAAMEILVGSNRAEPVPVEELLGVDWEARSRDIDATLNREAERIEEEVEEERQHRGGLTRQEMADMEALNEAIITDASRAEPVETPYLVGDAGLERITASLRLGQEMSERVTAYVESLPPARSGYSVRAVDLIPNSDWMPIASTSQPIEEGEE